MPRLHITYKDMNPVRERQGVEQMTREIRIIGQLAGLALLLGLGACASPRADAALYAQNALLGMPKQSMLSCAGVPDKTAVIDNLEYATYVSRQTQTRSYATTSVMGGGPGWWGGGLTVPLYDTSTDTSSCQTTFVLTNGVVTGITYGGDTSGGVQRLNQCYYIVENCLKIAPPPPAGTRPLPPG